VGQRRLTEAGTPTITTDTSTTSPRGASHGRHPRHHHRQPDRRPELRYTPNGTQVANFRLAVTARVKDGDTWRDGETSFFRVNVWRQLAEHVAESLAKGDWAVVIGRLKSPVGRPPGGQAVGSRGRGRRGRPVAALGHCQAPAGR
jgi:Single-strand binding protein family